MCLDIKVNALVTFKNIAKPQLVKAKEMNTTFQTFVDHESCPEILKTNHMYPLSSWRPHRRLSMPNTN